MTMAGSRCGALTVQRPVDWLVRSSPGSGTATRMPNAEQQAGLGEAARYQDARWPTWQINGAPAGLRRAGAATDDL